MTDPQQTPDPELDAQPVDGSRATADLDAQPVDGSVVVPDFDAPEDDEAEPADAHAGHQAPPEDLE